MLKRAVTPRNKICLVIQDSITFPQGQEMWADIEAKYKKLSGLQTEYIEKHEEISPGVFRIIYSDRSIITVDYNNGKYTVE